MAQIIIQKFGGTSLATADLRKTAATRVIDCLNSGCRPVVVVSAIGRSGSPYATDTLLEFASESAQLSGRSHDLIASCGETISAVVFSQLLNSLEIEAVPLTGAQAGILTDRLHSTARVTAVDCERIDTHVQAGQVPIVAGYQGYADNGDVTTLGRGGSDTTACVLGAALKATRVGDGIDAGEHSDIYSNDIWNTSDDSIEADGSHGNVRIWGNRMHGSGTYHTSFQPQYSGPWYFLYNQMAGHRLGVFKWSEQDRFVFINNTIIGRNPSANYFLNCFMRNNIFVGDGDVRVWESNGGDRSTTPDWRTDIDYDGFDWYGNSMAFYWDGRLHPDVPSFSAAVGIESNGIEIDANSIFSDFVQPRTTQSASPNYDLTLVGGANSAIDAGAYVPNLADFYIGAAPDLGAHERGTTPRRFGPRSDAGLELHQRSLDWAKH